MPPKKNATAGDAAMSHACTDSEVKLMLSILKHIPRPSTFDLDRIAEDLGSASTRSVRERIRQIGNKYGWFSAAASTTAAAATANGTGPDSPKTPPAKRARVGRQKKEQPANEGKDEDELGGV